MDCYEENKGTDILGENVRLVQNENIAITFCKFCDKMSTLQQNADCCGNKVHEGENYLTAPVKDNSIHEGKYFVNSVKIGKKHAPKIITGFTLNTSCFGEVPIREITPAISRNFYYKNKFY